MVGVRNYLRFFRLVSIIEYFLLQFYAFNIFYSVSYRPFNFIITNKFAGSNNSHLILYVEVWH